MESIKEKIHNLEKVIYFKNKALASLAGATEYPALASDFTTFHSRRIESEIKSVQDEILKLNKIAFIKENLK